MSRGVLGSHATAALQVMLFPLVAFNWLSTEAGTTLAMFRLKFGLSEKHIKFEKIFLMVLTNQLIYLVNVKTMRKIFFQNYVCYSKSPNFNYKYHQFFL